MINKVFALVDCNNFYASCERLFRPELQKKPIVVLSNNDGCIVARSNEAKALGIPMAAPYFKNKELIKKHNIHVFSSNYSLYGDLSHRVMSVLQEMEPDVEIYSIDEAFISLPEHIDHCKNGAHLKSTVEQHVGIPVSVGIARTKTLAKIANRFAKKEAQHNGVFNMTCEDVDDLLSAVIVEDVWGIGSRSTEKLNGIGIFNALQLKDADDAWIKKHLTITGLRTVMELRGISCISLEKSQPNKKSIISSRSFSRPISSLNDLKEAVSTHASIASKKIRAQGLAATAVHVFIYTNSYKKGDPQHSGNIMVTLPQASSYTPTIIKHAIQGLEDIFRPGYKYKKAGVMMTGLVGSNCIQQNMFLSRDNENVDLMNTIDQINAKLGRNTVQFAGEGLTKSWGMKQSYKSPSYTTNWKDLPVVTALL